MPVPRRTYLIAAGGFLLLAAVLFWAVVRVGPAEEGDSREAAASVEGEAGSADAAPTDTASEQVVYGTVTSVDEGLPVGDAVIGFVEGGDAMSNAAEAADGVRSDDSGAYEVALPADAGGMAVQCSARGFVRETRPIPDGEGRVRLDFLLYRSAYVGGTVTDVDTLAPVAGVTVCLLDARANVLQLMRQQNRLQAITDAAGTYGFDGVPAGPYRAVVHPKAAGYLFQSEQARHLEVQAKSVYDDVDFALAAGGAVTGIVLDEQGEPVEGAQVLVLPTGLVQTFMNRLSTLDVSPVEDYVTRTEPDGTFRVPGLDHDVEFRVRAEAKGYAWTVSDPFVTNRAAPEAKVRLILPRGCSVSGRLMHDDGTPAANRRVMMTWAGTVDSVAMTARPYSSTSGEDGSFVLEHITAGEYALRARGSAPRLLEVDGTTDVTGIEMSVGPREIPGTEVIAGTVVDASGSSVADVRVQALRGRRRSSRSVTGSDGSFELGGLRAGRYDVIARCDAGRAEQSAVATGDTVTLA
ncbi:MAG: carboxypeptidase regulatory-like domain-containing protein, partial [bacterium]|nr:carboxypeptidase regulatory-like domain-containing protein [bacterium]